MSASILSCEMVTYAAGAAVLINEVSCGFGSGILTGVIGPNGAGKSTLLRLLDGLLVPRQGKVRLRERPISNYSAAERAREIAFLPGGQLAPPDFTVRDIVATGSPRRRRLLPEAHPAFFGKHRPLDPRMASVSNFSEKVVDGVDSRVLDLLHRLNLDEFRDRLFGSLSTGEKQLVLIARVLMQDTAIVLLDEPTSNLDIGHEHQILDLAAGLAREGRLVLAALHNIEAAARYCDRLLLLHHGRVTSEGTPAEIMRSDIIDGVYGVRTRIRRDAETGFWKLSVGSSI